jgi:hypothetical protein
VRRKLCREQNLLLFPPKGKVCHVAAEKVNVKTGDHLAGHHYKTFYQGTQAQYGRHDTQHNNIHHNDTPHKRLTCDAQHKGHSAKLTLNIITLCHCAVCCYAEGHVLLIIMLNIVMLSVVMLSVMAWLISSLE